MNIQENIKQETSLVISELPKGNEVKRLFIAYYAEKYEKLFQEFIRNKDIINHIIRCIIKEGSVPIYIEFCSWDEVGDYSIECSGSSLCIYIYGTDYPISTLLHYLDYKLNLIGYKLNVEQDKGDSCEYYGQLDLIEVNNSESSFNLIGSEPNEISKVERKYIEQLLGTEAHFELKGRYYV